MASRFAAAVAAMLVTGCSAPGDRSAISAHPPLTDPQRSALADSIRALAAENMATWNRLDSNAWMELFDEGVRWYYRDEQMDRAGIEDMLRKVAPMLRESRTEIVGEPHVLILGLDTAVIGFRVAEHWIPNDDSIPPFERATALTFVYHRTDGVWKVVHVHESWAEPEALSWTSPVG